MTSDFRLKDTMELVPAGSRVGWVIHARERCAGDHCPFHNPSDHKMRDWPIVLRENTLTERVCAHGCGHPDPDSLAFLDPLGDEGLGVHGCDGCCPVEGG